MSAIMTSDGTDLAKNAYPSLGLGNSFAFKFVDPKGRVHRFNCGMFMQFKAIFWVAILLVSYSCTYYDNSFGSACTRHQLMVYYVCLKFQKKRRKIYEFSYFKQVTWIFKRKTTLKWITCDLFTLCLLWWSLDDFIWNKSYARKEFF